MCVLSIKVPLRKKILETYLMILVKTRKHSWSYGMHNNIKWNQNLLLLLFYFDLRPGQTCHYKDSRSDTSQWPLIERNRAGELGWWYGTRWRSHCAATVWCTGREWPVNCMIVIYAWWRSNMPLQRLSGRLSGRWTII